MGVTRQQQNSFLFSRSASVASGASHQEREDLRESLSAQLLNDVAERGMRLRTRIQTTCHPDAKNDWVLYVAHAEATT